MLYFEVSDCNKKCNYIFKTKFQSLINYIFCAVRIKERYLFLTLVILFPGPTLQFASSIKHHKLLFNQKTKLFRSTAFQIHPFENVKYFRQSIKLMIRLSNWLAYNEMCNVNKAHAAYILTLVGGNCSNVLQLFCLLVALNYSIKISYCISYYSSTQIHYYGSLTDTTTIFAT